MPFFQSALGPKNRAGTFLRSVVPYREESLNAIFQRASEIARQRGIRPRPAPLKFLARFVESASLEDRHSDLAEAWARLLVAAAQKYDPVHNAYLNVLGQIGPNEVRLLQNLFEGGGVEVGPERRKEEIGRNLYDIKRQLRKIVVEALGPVPRPTQSEFHTLCNKLPEVIRLFYGAFTRIVCTPEPNSEWLRSNEQLWEKRGPLDLLENLRLIRLNDLDYRIDTWDDGAVPLGVHVEWVMLTEFGFNFVKTCQGAGKPSTERPLTEKGRELVWRAQQPPDKVIELTDEMSDDDLLKALLGK